ncbi:hypothetical protein GGR56DRAFT_631703 [Xylariaceae sp. FL0804]|nr:hypothetical protein GGR56DRAFT_631703 [Xylariaceae sp. FL0804]
MATIKAIEARSVHQIQSGQVIVDLCSVVKELVENSIDAGATNIEVRFKNQGLDSIEVQDNGSGIAKENYETLALKHYTSKLSTYADLTSLQTFGFRGEALSSLCALSKFSVTTCLVSDAPKGSRLEYETSGRLRSVSVVAAQKGTTVTIEGLFRNLPVRRRELERNIKREWNKVLVVLNQYACIKTGLKFSVSQQPNKGKKMVLFSTKGNQTTRENIVNVFGAKTLTVLIPLDLKLQFEPTSSTSRLRNVQDDESKTVHVLGHVSRPAHGEGRQTPDRQMFYVNGRPCGLPQFAKVFNEVYKSYNASQSPFIFADIQLDTHLYDVNVSPDKRTILLHDQTRMLDNLRESLSSLFDSQDYALPTSQIQAFKQTPFKKPSLSSQPPSIPEDESRRSVSAERPSHHRSVSAGPKSTIETDSVCSERQPNEDAPMQNVPVSAKSSGDDLVEQKSDPQVDTPPGKREDQNAEVQDSAGVATAQEEPEDATKDLSSPASESGQTPSTISLFRDRLKELGERQSSGENKDEGAVEQGVPEPPIPAIYIPPRASNIKANKMVPSASAKRAAPEVATITIGDQTVTSIIGSPAKKQRTDNPHARKPLSKDNTKGTVPVPSFNGRLTQMFAAQAQTQHSASEQPRVTMEMRDMSEQSDDSREELFVSDTDEEDVRSGGERDISAEKEQENSGPSPAFDAEDESLPRATPPSPAQTGEEAYVDEETQQPLKEAGTQDTTDATQSPANLSIEEAQKRTHSFIKGGARKKDATCHLQQGLRIDANRIRDALDAQSVYMDKPISNTGSKFVTEKLDAEDAEEKLSLTISKADFGKMKIIGQFNLGFILASRPAETANGDGRDDELFIIDQHATDEKYNFERLQASTVVQSQRLVHPKVLELTAVEEETVQENLAALETNGFMVDFDDSGDEPVGTRCKLLSLPLSRETTFSLIDLEELISLLRDHHHHHPSSSASGSAAAAKVPRPSKVRKMFAMRACRSSVMIGRALSRQQMERLVRHMGEIDKPWNCPHGRPTMRHLCGLGAWGDVMGWKEGDGLAGGGGGLRAPPTDWAAYVRESKSEG